VPPNADLRASMLEIDNSEAGGPSGGDVAGGVG